MVDRRRRARRACAAIRRGCRRRCSTCSATRSSSPSAASIALRVALRRSATATTLTLRFEVSDTGIGIEPDAARPAVRRLRAGRQLDHAPLRRHRARPGDHAPAGRADGRRRRRATASPARQHASGSRRACARTVARCAGDVALRAAAAGHEPGERARRMPARACWWPRTTPPTWRSRSSCCARSACVRRRGRRRRSRPCRWRWRGALRPGADGHADAGDGRPGRRARSARGPARTPCRSSR